MSAKIRVFSQDPLATGQFLAELQDYLDAEGLAAEVEESPAGPERWCAPGAWPKAA